MLLPGISAGENVACALGTLTLTSGGPVGPVQVMLRPEQIKLDTAREGAAGRGVDALVRSVSFLGPEASVSLTIASGLALLARVPGHLAPTPGATVRISVVGEVMAYLQKAGL